MIRFVLLFPPPVPTRPTPQPAASPGEEARGMPRRGRSVRSCSPAPAPAHLLAPHYCYGCWQLPSTQHSASGCRERGSHMSGAEALGPLGLEPCTGDVPSLKELEQLLNTGQRSCNHVDEVWPNLFLGDLVTAHNRFILWKMGVTHVLNTAHGTVYSQGDQDYYGATIDYYGVPAHDLPSFDINQFFYSAAEFIHKALNTPGGMKLSLFAFQMCWQPLVTAQVHKLSGGRVSTQTAGHLPGGWGGEGVQSTCVALGWSQKIKEDCKKLM
ncbi:dual specificity protein phosphatase 26-like isoform X1 [Cygnus olor]|uniref:dual specificity protein phosphatase 26-like isoform X1 n=1 Tax=Cygnus olor TaxID=8869 RepID=UPI001ADE7C7D|nr:dual specificity protein phosphatase 26-like isoform X1 [Cygnus olor]